MWYPLSFSPQNELLCTVTVFISPSSGCLSCVIHVVCPIEIIYNFSVTGMFCVCVCDIPSCLVKVRDIRTPSKTLQFIGNKYHVISLLHVSALMGHQRVDGTTKLLPLMYCYSRTHIGLLGPKHVAYWKQNIVLQ
jgi:hypothetical protein